MISPWKNGTISVIKALTKTMQFLPRRFSAISSSSTSDTDMDCGPVWMAA